MAESAVEEKPPAQIPVVQPQLRRSALFDYIETPHQPKVSSGSCGHAWREGLVGVVDDVGDEAVVELADEFVE